jgi:hypothetical protein
VSEVEHFGHVTRFSGRNVARTFVPNTMSEAFVDHALELKSFGGHPHLPPNGTLLELPLEGSYQVFNE